MADNVIVSNAPVSVNPDIPVRSLDKSSKQTQVVAIDYGGAGAENLTVPNFATETTLSSLNTKVATGITVQDLAADLLGVNVVGRRNNQIEISFHTAFNSDLITNSFTSDGAATITDGHAIYSLGTNLSSTSVGQSVANVTYRPAHEQFVYFTAAWIQPGVTSNSWQRIGLMNTTNGFWIGYQGTNFGCAHRVSGANTFVNRTNWNGDLLTGASTSTFTRNGSPEAINLTYSNLFRIRFAWLGSAPVVFEVLSPDAKWVTFHTLRVPNSQLNPLILNPNLPIRVELSKTGNATELFLATACWAGGTTSDYGGITETLTDYSLAALNRSVITGRTTGGGGGYVNVKVNPSGALTTETAVSSLPTSTGAAPSFATVGTSSASIGLSTATYQKLIFCNTSVNTIALSFNGAAVASRGIVLAPGEKVLLDGPISVTTVNAIASAASSNLAIQAFT